MNERRGMLPLSQKRIYHRGKIAKYLDLLTSLYILPNIAFFHIMGVCNFNSSELQKFLELAKERKHIEGREQFPRKILHYTLTEEGNRCLGSWKSLEKKFNLSDLTPTFLPKVEIPRSEEYLSGKCEKLKFYNRKYMPNLYLSFLSTIEEKREMCVSELVFKFGALPFKKLREIGISKYHIAMKEIRDKKVYTLTPEGEECIKLFSQYVNRFKLHPLLEKDNLVSN